VWLKHELARSDAAWIPNFNMHSASCQHTASRSEKRVGDGGRGKAAKPVMVAIAVVISSSIEQVPTGG
jgi:hypothetical protein